MSVVRKARFIDTRAMADILREVYGRSIYPDLDEIDEREMKRLLTACVQKHGAKGEGACGVFVHENAQGDVDGFIIGMTQRVYHIGTKLSATDLFFLLREDASFRAGLGLWRAFEAWAKEQLGVVEIQVGLTRALGDYATAGKMYEKQGLTPYGAIYRRSLA
mgnify:CR=1 FL=1